MYDRMMNRWAGALLLLFWLTTCFSTFWSMKERADRIKTEAKLEFLMREVRKERGKSEDLRIALNVLTPVRGFSK